ncbi:MAG: 4-(cytidine 5'-diphospho)-2-C-methyl-D-erythritol kinase [Dehalococcoidia bacterium]|nr:4-(cytidine 5'-diphospho)-2-C-methyl-D-erythritol kinase [Dehalococcoidia bacterium]MDW8120435.1 4-(cytidine 5'-diphospho)-2-C-methyl-D-erythritol kinase [Chloroflexota bacterium]
MDTLRLRAYAKINLTLEVLGRRPDGYHAIASVLQTIALWDEVEFSPHPEAIIVECSIPSLAGPANVVYKTAHLLRQHTGVRRGVVIRVHKHIPVAGGLGGGSSDAATALQGLVRLWNLSISRERLVQLAACLGSDVPFFLYAGTALAEGRGEHITPLPPLPQAWFVLLAPPLGDEKKTARLYGLLRPQHWSNGSRTRALVQALHAGTPLCDALLYNTFEAVAFSAFPGLATYWKALEEATGRRAHLSGAGPSLYALVSTPAEAEKAVAILREQGLRAWAVHSVGAEVNE